MDADGLVIPEEVVRLIEVGRWPRDGREATSQHLRGWVSAGRVRTFAPEESEVHLMAPPFRTVRSCVEGGEDFWTWEMAAPGEISFDETVVIGDFGLGSDAPIVLDYRLDRRRPAVLRLWWDSGPSRKGNHWVGVARDAGVFVRMLGLAEG